MFEFIRKWRASREDALMFEREVRVEDKDGQVTATFPGGESQSVSWSRLEKVEVLIDDSGPWGADFWWVLTDANGHCSYPQGAIGEVELIPKLKKLHGFDCDALGRAMRCTDVAKFECWVAPNAAD